MKDKIDYIVMLIAEFAKRHQMTQQQAYRYLSQFKGIELCDRHYGIMHTLSLEDNLDSLALYCHKNGGTLCLLLGESRCLTCQDMNVTKEDFEYMKNCLTRDILGILVEERGLDLSQAFDLLYNSALFQKLETPQSGLYFQSPRYVLSYLDSETRP